MKPRMPACDDLMKNSGKIPIRLLPEHSDAEFPSFESVCSGRRGILLRLGQGSAYVRTERERGSKEKESYHISREAEVYALRPKRKRGRPKSGTTNN
jgi:hypothetical protein